MSSHCLSSTSCSTLLRRFDTKGGLNFAFATGLINPDGDDLLMKAPKGAHFLLGGGMGLPLTKKVKGGNKEELGEVGIDGQFGFYGEIEVDGKTTSDVVKVISE